ncbi:hypothetical protein BB560_006569 [Smittium megazygosporum]|uniref:Succinate dehydrogenase assembly factor 2, mitochondrial n=1 Tax=Smittium megazygosporum TaxID=133381 RepID=A0A2T9Y430_9FUNG|nr:hypothetical protein BB560_006569 [Smittium megazygosporum]
MNKNLSTIAKVYQTNTFKRLFSVTAIKTKQSQDLESTSKLPPKEQKYGFSEVEKLRRKLVWESRKRGILEFDIILSTFANSRLNSLNFEQLKEYHDLISSGLNDWDLFHWITGAKTPPTEIQDREIFKTLVEFVKAENLFKRMPNLEDAVVHNK